MSYFRWRPYVSVAQRRANAGREMQKLRKKGKNIEPVEIEGRKIAKTFWGEAWCNHLEQFSDYANRLPRGRTYVRNGSVCHLEMSKGKTQAIVSGSELYNVAIDITPLSSKKWKRIRDRCAGQIGSMLELLQGRLSKGVMEVVTDQGEGLFPLPKEIKLSCDCPDWAVMCKHVAAVLYAVGARLDRKPELLFLLRNVDHEELISAELDIKSATAGKGRRRRLDSGDLSHVFGVEIEDAPRPRYNRKDATAAKASRKTAKAAPGRRRATPTRVTGRKKSPVKETRTATSRVNPGRAEKVAKATAARSATASKKRPFTPTATAVVRLRKRFEMNRSQFATVLGVSPPAVAGWESKSGKLNLQQRTVEALNWAADLTKAQAWAKLEG